MVASRASFGHPRRRSRRHGLRGAAVEAPSPWLAIAAGLLVYSIAVLRVAWVQGFTNPLWTLLLIPGLRLGLSAYWAQLPLGLVTTRGLNRGSV